MTETLLFPDIGYQIKFTWEFDENNEFYFIEFVATEYSIVTTQINNGPIVISTEVDEHPTLDGSLKWDGCMNFQVKEGFDHICRLQHALNFAELFRLIYAQGEKLGFDKKYMQEK